MPTFTGKFEYLIDGKKVTQEQFQHLVDGKENDYDISIDNLRVVADKKGNEPFFLDEFLFPAKIEKIWLTDNTGGTVFEKVQDSTLPPHPTKELFIESSQDYIKKFGDKTSVVSKLFTFKPIEFNLDTYNAIVGHSTRHKAGKEIKYKDIWNHDKREAVSQDIQKDIRSQDPEQKQQVKNSSEQYKKEDLDYLKKQLLNSGLFISLEDATLIFNAETKEELQPLIDRTNPLLGESPVFNLKESAEHIIESFGKKETEGKLHYELSWEFIEEMAKRMANNKSDKYPLYNWKKPLDIQSLKDAINRHHIEVMKGNYKDGDEILGHIVQYACNGMMLWEQLREK